MQSTRPGFFKALATVFTGTLVVQVLGVARQIAFAAYFGADQTVDTYLLVVALATLTVFIFSQVVENACIPALVARRGSGEAAFRQLASSLFAGSLLGGVILATLFLVIVPFAAPIVGVGLDAAQQSRLMAMSWYFLPWAAAALPFYALTAIHKAQHTFARFLLGEIVVIAVSLAALVAAHSSVEATALAYGLGYAAGIVSLLPGSGVRAPHASAVKPDLREMARPVAELTASNAIAALGTLGDRAVQSFLPPGGIAANSYSGLIVSSASMLISFRDVFIVPFSEPADRPLKLERAVIGLAMLALPSLVFIALEAEAIVRVLLERGRFTSAATEQTATLLQIQALAILGNVLSSPLARMLQVIGRVNLYSAVLAFSAVATFVLGMVLVRLLGLGLVGYALVTVFVTYCNLALSTVFVATSGIRLDLVRVARYAAYALATSVVAAVVARSLGDAATFFGLLRASVVYGAIVLAGYALIYSRLRWIVSQR